MTVRLQVRDALDGMASIEDGAVDAVVTDPPYLISPTGRPTIISRASGRFAASTDIVQDFGEWDKEGPNAMTPERWIPEAVRCLKPGGTFVSFHNVLRMGDLAKLLEGLGCKVRHACPVGVWHKTNPVPQMRKVKWMQSCEYFIIAHREDARHTYNWQHGQHHDSFWFVVEGSLCQGPERVRDPRHPTQKPLYVMETILRYWTRPGDVVLDPFTGTGTTAVACVATGRHCVGFDSDPQWLPVWKRRVPSAFGGGVVG